MDKRQTTNLKSRDKEMIQACSSKRSWMIIIDIQLCHQLWMQHYKHSVGDLKFFGCMGASYHPGPLLISINSTSSSLIPIHSNFFNPTGEAMAMASTSFLLFFCLLSAFLLSALCHLTGFEGQVTDRSSLLPLHKVSFYSSMHALIWACTHFLWSIDCLLR